MNNNLIEGFFTELTPEEIKKEEPGILDRVKTINGSIRAGFITPDKLDEKSRRGTFIYYPNKDIFVEQ